MIFRSGADDCVAELSTKNNEEKLYARFAFKGKF